MYFLTSLATFMNLINTAIQASPTAALQLLTTPYASATFALACGTARHLARAARGAGR